MVQVYNLDIQRTLPLGIVLNIGYNGAKGGNLDIVRSPNRTPAGVTTPGLRRSSMRLRGGVALRTRWW